MIALAYYLLKVTVCSGILFLYYHFALRNKVFHQWNRFYLLAIVVLSLLVPVLQFHFIHTEDTSSRTIQLLRVVQSADHYMETIYIQNHRSMTTAQWLSIVYTGISAFILAAVIRSFFKIYFIIRRHKVQLVNQIRFVVTHERGTPFSFFRYIFWNGKIDINTPTGQQIFQHELVHVKEAHTFDKLFLQVILILFWCNPFFWLIRRELQLIHEFIADKKAVHQHDTAAFAAMILQAAYPHQFSNITNQFSQSSIKRRLLMLTKIQNPRINYMSRVLALPLIAFTVLAFGFRTRSQETTPVVKETNIKGIQPGDTTVSDQFIPMKGNDKPLVYLNGKEFAGDLNDLNPEEIKSINVLKKQSAIARYGEKGKNGIIEIFTKTGNVVLDTVPKNTPIFEKTEVEASVDKNEWRRFLEKNLQSVIENATKEGMPPGEYTVKIRFLIKKDGSVTAFKALNDPGYGLVQKLLEIIPNSPKWKPAEQNGKPVNSYHTQPITFVISDGSDSKDTNPSVNGLPVTDVSELKSRSIHDLIQVSKKDEILSFTLTVDTDGGDVATLNHSGNEYTAKDRWFIDKYIKPNKLFTVDYILVKRDGKETKIPSKIYRL